MQYFTFDCNRYNTYQTKRLLSLKWILMKLILLYFRHHRIPRWLHSGPLQPQEEQAAAHRQPQQEDDHISGMVSHNISV